MEMFPPEIFVNFKGIPALGDSRRDPDTFQIRPESEDSLYAADHHGGGGSRQPVYVGAAEMAAGRAFGKLTVAVRLEPADLCPVILCGGRILCKISECTVAMAAESFREDQPALRLGENTGVFFCPLIVDHGKRTVKRVLMVRRVHQDGAVCRIKSLIYIFQRGVSLLSGCESADHSPALGIQPEIRFRILCRSDTLALLGIAADKTVVIPAEFLDLLSCFFLLFFKVADISAVLFVDGKFL